MTATTLDELAHRLAGACATRLGLRLVLALQAADVAVSTAPAPRSFPLVEIALPFEADEAGESSVLLAASDVRGLLPLLGSELADPDEAELGEAELGAIAAAVAELLEGAADALAGELAVPLTLGAPRARLVTEAGELAAVGDDRELTYRLEGEGVSLAIAQTLPGSLVALLAAVAAEPEVEPAVEADEPQPAADSSDDPLIEPLERASRISADAAAEVLSLLFSEELSAATPVVTRTPGGLPGEHAYPLVVGELTYVAGLEGSNRFCLLPADVALLAAAMMGTPETTGDGLSAIELSAVSEALHQMMAAAAQALGTRLGIEIESSPPTCVVVDSAARAHEQIGETAYRTSLRFASTVFGAEIVQYVSPELAASLAAAFAKHALDDAQGFSISDLGDAFAGALLDAEPESPAALDGRAGAREILSGIRVRVSAELGRAKLPVARVANLPGGSVVVLDRAPTDPIDVLVNGTPFAQAKVVLVDGEYAVQILSLIPRERTG